MFAERFTFCNVRSLSKEALYLPGLERNGISKAATDGDKRFQKKKKHHLQSGGHHAFNNISGGRILRGDHAPADICSGFRSV
jgi:hypothetical protein